ncbi:hypothetical protein BpHYR1_039269 [Brachionus plicatilis]|uniref:Uncharacterized protein n=1 Tax=Brachionus plicatilis TaxID=10195 RepID=A0A3M7SYR9_BRAPC|nr:hypothetical protein BpHYR1_039269 [Brachionus plicatilis]
MLKLSHVALRHDQTKFKVSSLLEKFQKNERAKLDNQVFSTSQQSSPFELSSTISYTSTKSTKSSVLSANKVIANHPESRYVFFKTKCNPCVLDVNRLCIENDDDIDYFSSVHQPKFLSCKSTCSSVSSGSSAPSSLGRTENYLNILKIKDEDIQRKNMHHEGSKLKYSQILKVKTQVKFLKGTSFDYSIVENILTFYYILDIKS